MLSYLLKPQLGGDLMRLVETTNLFKILFPEFVSESVNFAIARIADEYGEKPSPSGVNIAPIQHIRQLLFDASGGYPGVNAYMIVAPHTHWEDRAPVIYSFDRIGNIYRIGVKPILDDEVYRPISFVFTRYGLLPYEWCDSSVEISEQEWRYAMRVLMVVNEEIVKLKYPLGTSIDFRFKSSLFQSIISTTEFSQIVDGEQFTKIVKSEDLGKFDLDDDFEQVAWHPVSDETMGLEKDELELLHYLKDNNINLPEYR